MTEIPSYFALLTDTIRITKDINSFLAEAEEKFPEEIWDGIRKRVGLKF